MGMWWLVTCVNILGHSPSGPFGVPERSKSAHLIFYVEKITFLDRLELHGESNPGFLCFSHEIRRVRPSRVHLWTLAFSETRFHLRLAFQLQPGHEFPQGNEVKPVFMHISQLSNTGSCNDHVKPQPTSV